jgi:hypothetical protein
MGRLCTPPPTFDPATTAIGVRGTPYPCPDIATLDTHLAWLRYRTQCAAPRFPALVTEFQFDIDVLLDRRRWLEIVRHLEFHAAT